MTRLSHLSHTLEASQILEISIAIKSKVTAGAKIHNYTIGDFDSSIFPIPSALKQEVMKAYYLDFTNYPPAEGTTDLREAIASFSKT
jgi:aspartate/methionine/tyrosine aminotransferase